MRRSFSRDAPTCRIDRSGEDDGRIESEEAGEAGEAAIDESLNLYLSGELPPTNLVDAVDHAWEELGREAGLLDSFADSGDLMDRILAGIRSWLDRTT